LQLQYLQYLPNQIFEQFKHLKSCLFHRETHMQFSVKIRPSSSKSFFDIHILLNAFMEAIVDAPHQQEMSLLAGAIKVTFTFFGNSYYIYLCNL